MKLIIEDDEGRRTIVPIVGEALTIGRDDDNHVRLSEKNVSRKHGKLVHKEGRFIVEDLKSFTGIRVNGEKVRGKRQVKEGDLIQISEYDLVLQLGPDDKPGGGLDGGGEDEQTITTDPGHNTRSAAPPPPPSNAFGDDDEPTVTPVRPRSELSDEAAAGAAAPSAQSEGAVSGAPALPAAARAQRPASAGSAGSSFGSSLATQESGASKVWIGVAAAALLGAVLLFASRDTAKPAPEAAPTREVAMRATTPTAAPAPTTASPAPPRANPALATPPAAAPSAGALTADATTPAPASTVANPAPAVPTAAPDALATAPTAPATAPAAPAPAPVAAASATPPSAPAPAPLVAEKTLAAAAPTPAPAGAPVAAQDAGSLNDADARRLLQQGNLKVISSDVAGGLADLEKAVELKPAGPVLGKLYKSLGDAHRRQHEVPKALAYYKLYLPYCDNPTEKAYLQQEVDRAESAPRP